MDNFIDSLEQKYANGKGNPKKGGSSASGRASTSASGSRKHRTDLKGKGRKKT